MLERSRRSRGSRRRLQGKPYRVFPPPTCLMLVLAGVVLLLSAVTQVHAGSEVASVGADSEAYKQRLLPIRIRTQSGRDHVSRMSRQTLERQAILVASTGGIYSSRYGAASPYMKRLSQELVSRAFPPGSRAWAACIVSRESGWNPGAISATDDHSLAQVNRPSHPWVDYRRIVVDPVYAVAVFVRLSDRGDDRSPWYGGSHSC